MSFVGSIDQGTSSTRFVVVNRAGEIVAQHQLEHTQHYPQNGWVEHDPVEIWENTQKCIVGALATAKLRPSDLAAVGITNQRETTVVWDRDTGVPYHRAIVWNCTRTAGLAAKFAKKLGGQDALRRQTGLPLVSYFSALKLRWLLDQGGGGQGGGGQGGGQGGGGQGGGLREGVAAGRALFGTMDTWLLWQLSGRRVHATDVTNASRTLLVDLARPHAWDPALLAAFGDDVTGHPLPASMLPDIKSSSQVYGHGAAGGPLPDVPLSGILGDQHGALVGQACFGAGDAKVTYGTGCFLMMNTGPARTTHHPLEAPEAPEALTAAKSGLLRTVAYQLGGEEGEVVYALEGAVAVCGSAVQWLRDRLEVLSDAAECEDMAAACGDKGSDGLVFVPAFTGLFAPHWREDARGTVCGLTFFHTKRHLVKAALDAAAFQANDVLAAMRKESGAALTSVRVDGGMAQNAGVLQFQADIADATVVRPAVLETSALGAAFAAGLAVGFWRDTDQLAETWRAERTFAPAMAAPRRSALLRQWNKAVARSIGWVEVEEKAEPWAPSQPPPPVKEAKQQLRRVDSRNCFFDGGDGDGLASAAFFDQDDDDATGKAAGRACAGKAVPRAPPRLGVPRKQTQSVHPLLLVGVGLAAGIATAHLAAAAARRH